MALTRVAVDSRREGHAKGCTNLTYHFRIRRLPPGRLKPAYSADEVSLLNRERDVFLRNFGHWSTEAYGHGVLYRGLLSWGRIHPLPFTSEHGIPFGTSSLSYASQLRSRGKAKPLHLTWNHDVFRAASLKGIDAIRIPHPWSVAWRIAKKKREVAWDGPLLLVPHSLPEVKAPGEITFWKKYLEDLSGDQFPSAALVSHHDVGGIAQRELLNRGVPIFTLGPATGDLFFERFYATVGQFSRIIGPNLSSASFYSTDFGVPFELVGNELEFNYDKLRSAMVGSSDELHNRMDFKEKALGLFSLPVKNRQHHELLQIDKLVHDELSLDLLDFSFVELREVLTRRVSCRSSMWSGIENLRDLRTAARS